MAAIRAEVRALRAQISPHFIYNSLGAIASFVRPDPDRARELMAAAKLGRSSTGAPANCSIAATRSTISRSGRRVRPGKCSRADEATITLDEDVDGVGLDLRAMLLGHGCALAAKLPAQPADLAHLMQHRGHR